MAAFSGSVENDVQDGTSSSDSFNYWQGGNDTLNGLGGDDTFDMGSAFTAEDAIDGGSGNDTVFLFGTVNVAFTATTMVNVESLVLGGGEGFTSVSLTTHDATVAAGQILSVDGGTTDFLSFDGSAETDGTFLVDGGEGGDWLTGGAGSDVLSGNGGADNIVGGTGTQSLYGGGNGDTIVANNGGAYLVDGGTGDDWVFFSGLISSDDQINAGSGHDVLILDGTTTVAVASFSPSGAGFEQVAINGPVVVTGDNTGNQIDFSLTPVFDWQGGSRHVQGEELSSLEIDGAGGDDILTGSNWGEAIYGGAGNNTLTGLGGDDLLDVSDSSGTNSLYGGLRNDALFAGSGNDTLMGDEGNDELYGGAGHAYMNGGSGADLIVATGGGTYIVDGGTENDEVQFTGTVSLADQLQGGLGTDKLRLSGTIDVETKTFSPASSGFERVVLAGGVTVVGDDLGNTIDFSGTQVSLEGNGRRAFGLSEPVLEIDGGAGDDSLTGTKFDDAIYGGTGSNDLSGLGGDDLLDVSDSSGSNSLYGGSGRDELRGGAGYDSMYGGEHADTLIGGTGYDTMWGDGGNDTIDATNGGNYQAYGGAGNDEVDFSGIFNTPGQLDGGLGTDTLALIGKTTVTTSLFAPAGLGFENVAIGPNTKVVASDSANTIDFSGVTVSGSLPSAVLTIIGNGGGDTITGSNWTDAITGGGGNDIVDGGTGGDDTLDGGVGFNRLSFAHASTGVNVSLALHGAAQDVGGGRMLTLDNFRFLTGSSHNDALTGDDGANIIDGGAGNDSLAGGLGADNLTGGQGADSFVFLDTTDSLIGAGNRDIIGFRHSQSDLIDVHAIDADTTTGGNQDFHLVAGGNFSQVAGELIQFHASGHTIVQGDVDGDGSADFEIQLTTNVTLVDGDFVF